MTLVFLGTRGYIEKRTRRHFRHTATLVVHRRRRVMIDCGEDWTRSVSRIRPDAIVLTHAHPDHALGLREGAPCPVYATAESWMMLGRLRIAPDLRRIIVPRRCTEIAGVRFEAFPVIHSVRAPAVGYRIITGAGRIFYVPDVLDLRDRAAALAGIRLYIGDGATVVRPLVRRERITGTLIGHTSVRTQLGWCREASVPRMIVTHCGTQI